MYDQRYQMLEELFLEAQELKGNNVHDYERRILKKVEEIQFFDAEIRNKKLIEKEMFLEEIKVEEDKLKKRNENVKVELFNPFFYITSCVIAAMIGYILPFLS